MAAALCVLGLLVGPVQASTNVFRLPADFSSQAGAAGFTCWYHLPSGDVLVPMVWDKFRPLERKPNAPRMWVGRDVPYLFINQDEARRWLLMAPGRQGEEPVITWKAPRTGRVAIWLAAKNATLCPPGPVPAARLRLTGGNGQPVAPDWPVGKRGSIPHIAEAVVEVLAGQSLRLWLSPKERSPCHRVGVQWSINYLDQGAAQTGPPPPARFVGGPASAKSGLTFWKGRLAWQEKTGRRQEEIRLLDLVGGGIQTLARGNVTAGPVLDGNRAAWALWDKTRKERPFYIVVAELASLASREVFAATRKLTHLALYGRWLAFAQRPQVTALNLADGRLARPPRGERTQSFPTLSGDTMAWDDGKDVFAMDLATGRARQVNPGNSGLCTRPDIWGHWLVYHQDPISNTAAGDQGDSRIVLFDLDTGQSRLISDHRSFKSPPRIYAGQVVWLQYDEQKKAQVWRHDIDRRATRLAAAKWSFKSDLCVYENQAAWLDHGQKFRGDSRIALVDIGASGGQVRTSAGGMHKRLLASKGGQP